MSLMSVVTLPLSVFLFVLTSVEEATHSSRPNPGYKSQILLLSKLMVLPKYNSIFSHLPLSLTPLYL